MQDLLTFAKGPLFVVTFSFMLMGLGRLVVLQVAQFVRSIRRLSVRKFETGKNVRRLVEWLVPVGHIYRNRALLSLISFVFHLGLLAVPLFLAAHIDLLRRSVGIFWPAVPPLAADILTLTTITAALLLLGYRMVDYGARMLSSASDYFLLLMVLIPFVSGFMALHPWCNPVSYDATLLVHVLSSEALFVLVPTTKLAHCVLFPFDRFSSEIYWKMPMGAGERVARELHGKEARV
jgi:nitrate reductase gamma subunit